MSGALSRTYELTRVLVISQLRANRSKSGSSRFWERPSFILFADVLALSLSWFVTFEILSVLPQAEFASLVDTVSQQALAFIPMIVLVIVLLVGIMFELNASSRFASSDTVNWLPISRSEYVIASAISVGYNYSPYFCIAEGVGLALAMETGLFLAWSVSFGLSILSLFAGGLLVEVLRASINRVYSVMSKKTGRATLVVRLVLIIVIIVSFQAVFNPNLLFSVMNLFVGVLDASFFVPIVWPSLAIFSLIGGEVLRTMVFVGLTGVFIALLFIIAVLVRSRYWSPVQVGLSFGNGHSYVPHMSRFQALGMSPQESSIVSKDLRAYVRKKELVAFLAMPFVFTALLALQKMTLSSDTSTISWLVVWFVGFATLLVSASSIGTEGKSIVNLYVAPIDPKQLVRAKATFVLILSIAGALLMSIVGGILFVGSLEFFAKVLVLTVPVSVQSVFIGLFFATRNSDFVDRPRPRYISTWGMLKTMIVGLAGLAATSLPVLFYFNSNPIFSVVMTLGVFIVISFVAYRYTIKGARELLAEMRT